MAVIQDYMHGDCHIIVHDDYIQPPEVVKEIVNRVSQIVINEEFRKAMQAKETAKNQSEKDSRENKDVYAPV